MTHSDALTFVHPASPVPEVTPLCPHFGPCGGCQLQHLPYPAQLTGKHNRLVALLSSSKIEGYPPIQTRSAHPWQYRNRVRLRVEPAADGSFAVGYNHHKTNIFLPIRTCPISAGILLQTALSLTELSRSNSNAMSWLAATAELELFTVPDESLVQLTLLLRSAPDLPATAIPASFERLCAALKALIPQLFGAGAELLRTPHANSSRPRANRRSAARFTPPVWGSPGLLYPVTLSAQPAQLWVSRPSFFQVNRFLVETLVSLATSKLQQWDNLAHLAWDLFAGVGLFTRALAPHFRRVIAVESALASTADLAAARLPNVDIVTATVLDFLRVAALGRDRPDLVLLDPPRAGLGLEASTLLARLKPARIVYVSCDPATLARDLVPMLSSGYNLAELHLVDMFPQTSHQETVAILHRNDQE